MWMFDNLSKMGDMKKMYDKYKTLEKTLKNLVIRAKEWKFYDNWTENDSIIIDITGEMKIKDLKINDPSYFDISKRSQLEETLLKAFQKAQTKAQEIAAEKTKEILWVDTNDLAGMLGAGWLT